VFFSYRRVSKSGRLCGNDISVSSVAQTFLTVDNVLGQQVAILVNQNLQPGTYEVNWNAADLTSGVYFYTLKTEEYSKTKKMLLIK